MLHDYEITQNGRNLWFISDRAQTEDFHMICWTEYGCSLNGQVEQINDPLSISYEPKRTREPANYKIKKCKEEVLEFENFNFKLAVVTLILFVFVLPSILVKQYAYVIPNSANNTIVIPTGKSITFDLNGKLHSIYLNGRKYFGYTLTGGRFSCIRYAALGCDPLYLWTGSGYELFYSVRLGKGVQPLS